MNRILVTVLGIAGAAAAQTLLRRDCRLTPGSDANCPIGSRAKPARGPISRRNRDPQPPTQPASSTSSTQAGTSSPAGPSRASRRTSASPGCARG